MLPTAQPSLSTESPRQTRFDTFMSSFGRLAQPPSDEPSSPVAETPGGAPVNTLSPKSPKTPWSPKPFSLKSRRAVGSESPATLVSSGASTRVASLWAGRSPTAATGPVLSKETAKDRSWSMLGGKVEGLGISTHEEKHPNQILRPTAEVPISAVVVDNDLKLALESESTDKALEESEDPSLHVDKDAHHRRRSSARTEPGAGQHRTHSCRSKAKHICVDIIWPAITRQKFADPQKERRYMREEWANKRTGAILAALFFIVTWMVFCAFVGNRSMIFYLYVAFCGAFTVPLPLMIMYNLPLRAPWLYQSVLLVAVWSWPFLQTIQMSMCDFFGQNKCGKLKFLTLFGSLLGPPTIAMFVMGQNRIIEILSSIAWLCYGCTVIYGPLGDATGVPRAPIQFALYHVFLVIFDFYREKSNRQMFLLRDQLKVQYRAVQAAQVMERKADQSKKRFVSYIFHEVRVPLNTALLAVQNLKSEGVCTGLNEDMREMVYGLMGSLNMMEQVLNDVLSFNRMESGRFVQVKRPFDFRRSIQLVELSHRAQAAMKGVDFNIYLDDQISNLGLLVGDEMRLRQVTSNLVSNALKFTPSGSVIIVTQLLSRGAETGAETTGHEGVGGAYTRSNQEYSTTAWQLDSEKGHVATEDRRQSRKDTDASQKGVIVRVEVRDTGVGISPDAFDDNGLFSPYVQTEIGRRQGGKGSGLGLALVRQIVDLSGGRLGVDSEVGVGSTFWFELPFTLDSTAQLPEMPTSPVLVKTPLLSASPVMSCKRRLSDDMAPWPVDPRYNGRGVQTPRGPSPTNDEVGEKEPEEEAPSLLTLVVDDDLLTRKLMARMLQRLGNEVVSADNGEAGLKLITASHEPGGTPFDVVFLDNQMPKMCGVEVVQCVRDLGLPTLVVGCTGNALQEDQEEYLAAGANRVLSKPIHQSSIEEVLTEARQRRTQGVLNA